MVSETLSDFERIINKNNSKETGYKINCKIGAATLGVSSRTTKTCYKREQLKNTLIALKFLTNIILHKAHENTMKVITIAELQ